MSNFILFGWFLSIGWLPIGLDRIGTARLVYDGAFTQTIGIEAIVFDDLRIWTEIETEDFMISAFVYAPFRSTYRIGAEYTWRNITAGIKHDCIHPVLSPSKPPKNYASGGSTEFFLTIKGGTYANNVR